VPPNRIASAAIEEPRDFVDYVLFARRRLSDGLTAEQADCQTAPFAT
jgi:hypothetical protein